MNRTLLLSSSLLFCFTVIADADTLVDVFDDSLQSQIMQISASDVERSVVGTEQETTLDARQVNSRRIFHLASTNKRLTGRRSVAEFWTPGDYPAGLLGDSSIIATTQDEYLYYFASDLEKRNDEILNFQFNSPMIRSSSDHYLEDLPEALKR